MPDDLYGLIGVEPDATTDEIRERYRARRSELDAVGTEQSRADAAALNRAWNILSDPYQRGRYDAQQEANGGDAEDVDADEVEVLDEPAAGNGQAPKRRKLFEPADTKTARPRPQPQQRTPTIEVPAGMTLAETRPRVTAMVIDMFVLLLLFAVVQIAVGPIEHHFATDNYNALTAANKVVTNAQKEVDAANKNLSAVKKAGTSTQAAQARVDAAKKAHTDAVDKADAAARKLVAYQYAALFVIFVAGLLYLVVPTAMNGQTLGKRLQHIRVVRQDGTAIGFGGAMKRFGPPVLVTLLLFVFLRLGPVAALLVIIAIVGWTRNPNRQGMHDRFAKTLVVNAD